MICKKHFFEFEKTGLSNQLVIDFLNDQPTLSNFFNPINTIGDFRKMLEAKSNFRFRNELSEVASNQYHSYQAKGIDVNKAENLISKLSSEKTFTVTTGHQLNVMTGPLYFIYKIVSCINLAKMLKQNFTDCDFIPVYWPAGEDHDVDEICSVNVFGKKISWQNPPLGATGKLSTNGIQSMVEELKLLLPQNSNTEKIISLFEKVYQQESLLDATVQLVLQLFSDKGLLVVNGDDKNLKKIFSPVMKDDLLNASAFAKVNESVEELKNHGYNIQANPREINLFFIDSKNQRHRIVREENHFHVHETNLRFTRAEIENELENHPEKFSPNVVLRPLYQEYILPNIAYIGGPGELSYWLEYKRMFDFYQVPFPALILRNHALILSKQNTQVISKLGLDGSDIFSNADEIIRKIIAGQSNFSIDMQLGEIEKMYDDLKQKISGIDASLIASVEGEKQKVLNGLKAMNEKALRAQKKKSETVVASVQKLKNQLFPEGNFQERILNFSQFYVDYGDDFFKMLYEHFNPMERKFIVLSPAE